MLSVLIDLAVIVFSVIAGLCVFELARSGYDQPKGTLWPDEEPAEPASLVPFTKPPVRLTDFEMRKRAELIVRRHR